MILMHRQIMQPPEGMLVDHIDGNKANNCRVNLRVCTCARRTAATIASAAARPRCSKASTTTSGDASGLRKCQYQGKPHLARLLSTTEVEAARAYDRKAVELFGEFARLNFPREWPPERRAEVYAQRQEPDVKTKVRRSEGKKGRGKKPHAKRNASGAKRKTPAAQDATLTASKTLVVQCTTKSAQAAAAKPQRKGQTNNRKAEGRGGSATIINRKSSIMSPRTPIRGVNRKALTPSRSRIWKRRSTSRHLCGVVVGWVAGSCSGIHGGQLGSCSILLRNNRLQWYSANQNIRMATAFWKCSRARARSPWANRLRAT